MSLVGVYASISSNRAIVEHASILSLFEHAKVANHDLNENILRLRTFMLHSYDPIVRDVFKLKHICQTIDSADEYQALRDSSTIKSKQLYCEAVSAKGNLVEEYKSKHSVLRNSIKYLPLLAKQLKNSPYESQAQAIVASILLYNIDPSVELENQIDKLLVALPTAKSKSKYVELVESLNLHAHTVVRYSRSRLQLENKILSAEISRSREKLEGDYLNAYQIKQKVGLIYFYSLLLICFALGAWLLKLLQQVKKSGDILQNLNMNLESKVNERTHQLSEALKQLADSQHLVMQSAKMTALGEMAGGIAHEINTPLSAILMNAGAAIENLEPVNRELIQKRLESIVKIVARVSKVVQGLRRFSRSADLSEKSEVLVQTIVEDTLTLCAEKLKSQSIDIQLKGMDTQLAILCVPEHISQVLLNFLNNSLDALRDSVAEKNRWIEIKAETIGGLVELSVTDAGAGLPIEIQNKLMQPFFTTKPTGVGTGLGLSISKGIVEQHGGQLYYDSNCKNTRFVMRLPAPTVLSP